jgi:hypothetical protein
LLLIIALPSLDEAGFQKLGEEKSSLRITDPTPGFRSGVGSWMVKGSGEGVADGGNQTIVGEGGGVTVAVGGLRIESVAALAQAVIVSVKTEMKQRRMNFILVW